jgi:hypothetical protein
MRNSLLTTSFAAIAFSQGGLQAQTTATIDGTAGSNSVSTAYSTNGGLNLSLGFFAEYLILGGGGGGGGLYHAGGGGGGGLLTGSGSLTSQSYAITVGTGGAGGTGANGVGGNGGNSTALGLSAIGGGGGGGESQIGKDGGSGGGNGWTSGLTSVGLGTAGQGYNGGLGSQNNVFPANGRNSGGGGGGAGAAGTNAVTYYGGAGGAGAASSITGTSVYYAGGGGGAGGGVSFPGAGGAGGIGGGGAGATGGDGTSGTNSLGGGGGGATSAAAGGGGSGVVIIRYKGVTAGTGGTVSSGTGSATGYTIHTFTNTGSSSLDLSSLNLNTRLGASLSGVISGTGDFTYSSGGALTLAASNTFTGGTRTTAGILNLGHVNALAGSTLDLNAADSGTVGFTLAGANTYNIGGLQGSRNLDNAGNTMAVGANNSNTTYSGSLSGAGALSKVGTGKLIIAGTNTYSGTTTVSAGSLAVNGSLASSSTSVVSGATLQGSGSLSGAVSILEGGTLSAGNSIESLATGSLTIGAGANFYYEIDNSVAVGLQGDLVAVSGTLSLDIANQSNLVLDDLSPVTPSVWAYGTKLTLISYSGAWNGGLFSWNGNVVADDSNIIFANGSGWKINYNDTSAGTNYSSDLVGSNYLTMTAVPEPTVTLLGGLGILSLLRRRRA